MPGDQQRREKEKQDGYQRAKEFHHEWLRGQSAKQLADTRAANAAFEKRLRERTNRDVTSHGNGAERLAVSGGSFGRIIKILFVLAALYGAYDAASNQSSISESAQKAGKTTYALSDTLGSKIKSIDPDSLLIKIVNDVRWVAGVGVSIDVGLGAGAGNAVVWVIRQAVQLAQEIQRVSSNASHNPELR